MTPELLRAATGCTQDRADLYAQHLGDACQHYAINTPQRLACFLGQLAHESGSLRWAREIAEGDAYKGRKDLGNTQPGDGRRYRGRGLIQITGRDNYRAAFRRMQPVDAPDFEDFPSSLEEPKWAAWSAADWWAAHGCNDLADAGDVVGLSRLINRGNAHATRAANGEDDRIQRTERARLALGVDQVRPADQGGAVPPAGPGVTRATPPATSMPAGDADPAQPEGKPMSTFSDIVNSPATRILLGLVNPVLEAVPEVARIFMDKNGTTVPERNVAAAVKIAEVAQTALQAAGKPASNMQEVVETIATDPQAKAIVRSAVIDQCMSLVEAGGGGIDGARKANAVYLQPGAVGFWLNPSFWISLILIAMPIMLLVDVLFVHPASYVGELRTQIVTGVLMVIGMVGGYWIGTSISSAKKDDRTAAP